ncbi:MAG: hypothetical protein ABMA15_02875 [Vicinamibacterales bacterium]
MRLHILGSLLVGVTLAATPASADVHITMADGKVTVSAKNATVGQILNEWARVGQTRIVNIDRLPGTPVSIELTNLPEAQALDTVLRSASGYLAAPRAVALPNASAYDRIFVLATSAGSPARTAPAAPTQGAFVPPMFEPPMEDQDREPDMQRPGPVGGRAPVALPNRGGGGPFPTPIQRDQAMPTQDTPVPPFPPISGPPAGVSTPGMLVPTQQPPGQARPDNP